MNDVVREQDDGDGDKGPLTPQYVKKVIKVLKTTSVQARMEQEQEVCKKQGFGNGEKVIGCPIYKKGEPTEFKNYTVHRHLTCQYCL